MASTPIAQNALGWVRRFSTRQLVVAGLLAAIVIGGSVGLVSWFSAPSWAVLYSGLSAADAGPVTAKLDSDGVKYKLDNGGSTILVPQEQVDTTRIAMATAKLPAGGDATGCEAMENQSITTDSFTQKANYQSCLETKIASTLSAMGGVRTATVRLVMPEERLFTDQETPATAAVVLDTTRSLTDENIAAVNSLVARSVKNLDPANITVSDTEGRLLSGGIGGAGAGTGDQRKAQSAYEAKLQQQATTLLTPTFGDGKVVVRVNATMDFTQRSRATEEYDPKKSAAKETSSSKEQYSTTTKAPGGTLTGNPATGINNPPTTTTEQNYSKTADAQALNNTKTITQEVDAPGAVQRLTVSVLIDDAAAKGKLQANGGSLTDADLQTLIGNSVGLNAQRGDNLVVTTAPFDTSAASKADAAAKAAAKEREAAQKQKLYIGGGIGAALLIAVIGLLIMGLRSKKETIAPEEVAAATARAVTAINVPDLPPVPESTARLPLSVPDRDNEAAAVLSSVEARPEDAARVLRGMMADDSVQSGGAR